MHVYLYDSFLLDKKYESALAKIETRLTDLGLNGKIIRLSMISSIRHTIREEINKGAKTFIAVGNIQILSQVLNSMAKYFSESQLGKNTPLGFIPVGKNLNDISAVLGLDFEENACDFLAARRIETVDLGQANQDYFLTQAQITTANTSLEIDTNYTIEIKNKGEIIIANLPLNPNFQTSSQSKANDGRLELIIENNKKFNFPAFKTSDVDKSVFSFKEIIISNPENKLLLDSSLEISTPTNISMANEKIKLIIGKNRGLELF
jgi:hypothetical protein